MTKTGMETLLMQLLSVKETEEDSESLTPGTATVTGSGLPLILSALLIEDINSLDLFPKESS